ncbi:MAG: DoxX family membrane protein [Nitrospinota bacterium]|nr:DoxX family membrane protein [Nitrospinota bacterium]
MENTVKLVGRIAIAGLFAWAALREVMNPSTIMNGIKSSGVPAPGLVFVIVLIILIACSAMVIAGYKARQGALGLLVVYLIALFILKIDIGGGGKLTSLLSGGDNGALMKNLAIAGGLLYIYAAGPGVIGVKKG